MRTKTLQGTGEILSDHSQAGNERPWTKHRHEADQVAESFRRMGWESRAVRMAECGGWLVFVECPHCSCTKRLVRARFCRIRMCPMCQWRKSLLVAAQVRELCHVALQRRKLRFLHLTLTVKNCPASDLPATLDALRLGFNRMDHRVAWRSAVVGHFRALEVTYNPEADTYHPHYHCLLAVAPSYFGGQGYWTRAEWAALWAASMRLDYTPEVWVSALKPKKGQEGDALAAGVAEVSKYATKPGPVLELEPGRRDAALRVLADGLHGRRLFGFGGLLRDLRAELVQEDAEESDLIQVGEEATGCTCDACRSVLVEHLYRWRPEFGYYIG